MFFRSLNSIVEGGMVGARSEILSIYKALSHGRKKLLVEEAASLFVFQELEKREHSEEADRGFRRQDFRELKIDGLS